MLYKDFIELFNSRNIDVDGYNININYDLGKVVILLRDGNCLLGDSINLLTDVSDLGIVGIIIFDKLRYSRYFNDNYRYVKNDYREGMLCSNYRFGKVDLSSGLLDREKYFIEYSNMTRDYWRDNLLHKFNTVGYKRSAISESRDIFEDGSVIKSNSLSIDEEGWLSIVYNDCEMNMNHHHFKKIISMYNRLLEKSKIVRK